MNKLILIFLILVNLSCIEKSKYKIEIYKSDFIEKNDYYFINIDSGKFMKFEYFKEYFNSKKFSDLKIGEYNTNLDSFYVSYHYNNLDTSFKLKSNNYQMLLVVNCKNKSFNIMYEKEINYARD
ncbi:MAG: hypothetical protein NTW25_09585 [Candidatus Kapabacteria bacterium]|nr:hypothetical protein [Candidatus Kapabacteria bacterium]